MSSDYYRRQAQQHQQQIARLQSDKSNIGRRVADAQRKANSALQSASRASNASSANSYHRDAQRYQDEAAREQKKLADIEQSIAREQSRLNDAVKNQARDEERGRKDRQRQDDRRLRENEQRMRQITSKLSSHDTVISSLASLVRRHDASPAAPGGPMSEFDVFISHASEDKDDVVRPLAEALRQGGLTVWYDEFELRIGDSLRRKIDEGLARSRFGVVVLSREFFRKGWPNYELDGLVTRAVSGGQALLPIWHNITKQEVIEYSPPLADKLARSTATHTITEIAGEILQVVKAA